MLNHSKSLFLSLFVHALIVLSLFVLYKYVSTSIKPTEKETKICVHLKYLTQKVTAEQKTFMHKKIISKQKKVQKVEPFHKKVIKKFVKVKKTPVKKPEILQNKVPVKEEIKEKEAEIIKKIATPAEQKPQREKKTKIVKNEIFEKKISDKEQYIKENLAKIYNLIKENLYYPRTARKRGIEGSVTVRFILHKDATVTQITTISSNSGILTRAAIKTIAELSGKFPKPSSELMLSVPIRYSLH